MSIRKTVTYIITAVDKSTLERVELFREKTLKKAIINSYDALLTNKYQLMTISCHDIKMREICEEFDVRDIKKLYVLRSHLI